MFFDSQQELCRITHTVEFSWVSQHGLQSGVKKMVLDGCSCRTEKDISVDSGRLTLLTCEQRATLTLESPQCPSYTYLPRSNPLMSVVMALLVDFCDVSLTVLPTRERVAACMGEGEFFPPWRRRPQQPIRCLDGTTHVFNCLLLRGETLGSAAGLHANFCGHRWLRNSKRMLQM